MSPPRSGSVASSPRLHYLEWEGRGAGSSVLVHGNSANAWWWRRTVEAMDGRYGRMVALDLRGHGDSAWTHPPDYSPAAYGDDIARLIRALALDRPVVVGHSMGGIAALAFAQRLPELARAIVAIDVAVKSTARRNRYLRHLQALPTVVYPDLATALSRFRLMPREGDIAPAVLAAVAEHSLERTASGGYTLKFDRESFFGSDGLERRGGYPRAQNSAAADPRRTQPDPDSGSGGARRRVEPLGAAGHDSRGPSPFTAGASGRTRRGAVELCARRVRRPRLTARPGLWETHASGSIGPAEAYRVKFGRKAMADQQTQQAETGPRPILPILKLEPKPHLVAASAAAAAQSFSTSSGSPARNADRPATSSRFRSPTRARSVFFR